MSPARATTTHKHRLMLVQVDHVACELMAKHWGGSWRIIRDSSASKPRLRLVQADSGDGRPDVSTCGRADDVRRAA